MKRFLAFLLALVMLMSLVACGAPNKGDDAADGGNKKLVVWLEKLFNDRPGDKMAERMMAWGDANGVEVEVSFIGAVDFANKLSAAIEGGGMPDIFIDYQGRLLNYYPEMIAADVTDLYEELDEAVGFSDACANSCYFEGKARIIPMYSSGVIMYCRADKLQAAGYNAPPTTWAEVVEMARAVSDPDNGFFGLGIGCGPANDDDCYDLALNYVTSNGGAMFDEKGNVTVDNVGLRSWLELWRDLYAEEVIPTDALTWDSSGNNNTYLTGQSCFVFNAGTLGYSLANDESMAELYENTWFAPMPAGTAGTVIGSKYTGFSISEASENKELAMDLLRYIYKVDWLTEWSEYTIPLLVPAVESIAQSEMWQENTIGKANVQSCMPDTATWWGYSCDTMEGMAVGAKLVYTFGMNEICNGVASGEMTVDEAIAKYEALAQEVKDNQ